MDLTTSRRPAEIQAVQGRLQDVIRDGLPEVGWDGDPLLTLAYNPRLDRWEVWDEAFYPPKIVLAKPCDGIGDLDYAAMCRTLKEGQVPREKGDRATLADRVESRRLAAEKSARDSRLASWAGLREEIADLMYRSATLD